jgi:hypothetical protein
MGRGSGLASLVALTALCGCGGGQAKPDGGEAGIVETCEVRFPVQSVPGMPCRFPIPAPPCDAVDRGHINVFVGGTQLTADVTDGWTYTDQAMQTIDIHGPSCDVITGNPLTPVDIQFYIYGIPAPAL